MAVTSTSMNPNVGDKVGFAPSSRTRAQRKTLITVAEWGTGSTPNREVLGARTEDSSIEFNADIVKSTDILGITYADVNKTEPQQTFDPFFLLGDSALSKYLVEAALENRITDYNGKFTIYIIAAFLNNGTDSSAPTAYKTVKHTGCSIIPTSMGGDAYVSMPIEVHYSNEITTGTVDKLADGFQFTPDTTT